MINNTEDGKQLIKKPNILRSKSHIDRPEMDGLRHSKRLFSEKWKLGDATHIKMKFIKSISKSHPLRHLKIIHRLLKFDTFAVYVSTLELNFTFALVFHF